MIFCKSYNIHIHEIISSRPVLSQVGLSFSPERRSHAWLLLVRTLFPCCLRMVIIALLIDVKINQATCENVERRNRQGGCRLLGGKRQGYGAVLALENDRCIDSFFSCCCTARETRSVDGLHLAIALTFVVFILLYRIDVRYY